MCYMKSVRKQISEAVYVVKNAVTVVKEKRARNAESRFVVRMVKASAVTPERLKAANGLVVRARKAKAAPFLEQYRAKA